MKEEAIGQAIAAEIVEYNEIKKEKGFWNRLKRFVKDILDKFRNADRLDFDKITSDIAREISEGRYDRLGSLKTEQKRNLDVERTIDKAIELMQRRMNARKGVYYNTNTSKFLPEVEKEMEEIKAAAIKNGTFMKAPNGNPTNLTEKQWLLVRIKAFKEWFGDWEKATRVEKLKNSNPIVVSGNEYNGKYELNSKSAGEFILNELRGTYTNKDTGSVVRISRKAEKVVHHDAESDIHLKSIAFIPHMIENAIFITEEANEKDNGKFDSYRYYAVGLKVDGVDYTAKLTVGMKGGEAYYDHALTEIEKSNLINQIDSVNAKVYENQTALSNVKDRRLLSILQTDSSKVVDKNGEPLVVYHNTNNDFNMFDKSKIKSAEGFFFSVIPQPNYGNKTMGVFLNVKNLNETDSEFPVNAFQNMDTDGVSYFFNDTESFYVKNPNQIRH